MLYSPRFLSNINQAEIRSTRARRQIYLKTLNPNVNIPYPMCCEIKKKAVGLKDYDKARRTGKRAEDIPQV